MDSQTDASLKEGLRALEGEKQQAQQALQKAEAELRVAQQEAEWAKLALRLAEETLSAEELFAAKSLMTPPPNSAASPVEAKDNGHMRQGKFATMTPENILKEVDAMGDSVNVSVLAAALRAMPSPVEETGFALLNKVEGQCVSLTSYYLTAAISVCSDLHVERPSLWAKLCSRVKGIIKSKFGRTFKPNEICTCLTELLKTNHLDTTLAELFVAQARPIAAEFKPLEVVGTLVALSQVSTCAHFQLGELLDSAQKLLHRFSASEVARLLAAVAGLPSASALSANLATALRERSSELTWEGVTSALIVMGGKKGVCKLDLAVQLCEYGSLMAAESAQLGTLLAALAQLSVKIPGFLVDGHIKSFVWMVAKQSVQNLELCDASSVVSALSGLGKMSEMGIEPSVADALGARAGELAASFSDRQIAAIVRALVALGNKDHPALTPLLAQPLADARILSFPDLADLLDALALLGEDSRCKEVCDKAARCNGWPSGLLLGLLHTMVTLRHPALLAKLLAEANLRPFERKEILPAMATLLALGPQADSLKQKFYAQLQRELKTFSPRDFVELLNVLANDETQRDMFQKVCEGLASQPSMDLDTAEGALRCLANLKWDHQQLLKKLTAVPIPSQCSPATLTSVLRSLALFNIRPGPFLQGISAQVLGLLDSLSEQQAVDIAEALLSLEHEAPSVIEPLVCRLKSGQAPEAWPEVSLSLRVEHQDWAIDVPRLAERTQDFKLPDRPLVLAVSAALSRAQIPHRVNVLIEGLQADIALDESGVLLRVADEENCLHHSRLSIGSVLFRDRLLQKLQWKVARVGYFEWGILRGVAAAEERFISGVISAVGPTEPTPTQPPVTLHTKEAGSDDEDFYYAEDERVL